MRRQNETLRSLCRAPFGRLLHTMLRDPALLVWLDAPENTQGHPNENLARELMELFTLGIGHYSEDDVKQAARALTGWRLVGDEAGWSRCGTTRAPKAILGRNGRVRQPTGWPRCSSIIPPRPAGWHGGCATSSSAKGRSTSGRRARWPRDCGRTIWTSAGASRRCSDRGCSSTVANLGRRIASPIDYVLGAVRALEMLDPAPSTPVLADWCARLGQDLFYPPNVGGWPGGRNWITTRSALGRANFAAALVGWRFGRPGYVVRPDRAGRPAWPGAKPVVLRAAAAGCRWPRGPTRCAGTGPAGPRPTAGFSSRRSGFDHFLRR